MANRMARKLISDGCDDMKSEVFLVIILFITLCRIGQKIDVRKREVSGRPLEKKFWFILSITNLKSYAGRFQDQ